LASGGNDSFNSLQFAVTHRFRNGLFVDSLFQWEKELSDVFDSGGYTVIQNPYDRAQGRGKEILSPLEFRAQFTYELPFGPSKQLGNSVRKGSFLSGLIGGWQVSGFIELRDGRPFDVTFSGADPSNTGSFGGIVSVLPNCDTRPSNGIAGPYLNINCFTVPASGGFGNLGRNTFLGTGYRDFDA